MATTRLFAPRPYDSIDFGVATVAPILSTGTDVDNTKVAAVQAAAVAGGYGTLATSAGGTAPAPFAAPLRDRGPWQANTVYSYGDVVTQAGSVYVAPSSFTSGSSFVAGNWTKLGLYDATDPSLATTYVALSSRVVPSTGVIFGDSITAQNAGSVAVAPASSARGYMTWANVFLGKARAPKRLRVLANAGVGGNTSAQMLARLTTDVLSYAPGWVVMLGGANDVTNDVAPATTIANLKSMATAILAAGSRLVMCTITPTDNANTAARKQALYTINDWIRTYAHVTAGVVLCDWHAYLANPSDGTCLNGQLFQGTAGTRVHPDVDGAAIMGRVLADALAPHLPAVGYHVGSNADLGTSGTNKAPNPTMQGSGGTITGGSGATGTVPTSYAAFTGDGAAGVWAISTPARTDGIQGNWLQLKLGPANTKECHVTTTCVTWGSDINIGDTVYYELDLDADNDWTTVTQIVLLAYMGAGAGAVDSDPLFRSSSWATSTLNPCYDLDGTYTGPVRIKSPEFTIPAGADRLAVELGLQAASGTIRFGSFTVKKVVSP